MTVYVLIAEWDHDQREYLVVGVFANEQDAIDKMKEMVEKDIEKYYDGDRDCIAEMDDHHAMLERGDYAVWDEYYIHKEKIVE